MVETFVARTISLVHAAGPMLGICLTESALMDGNPAGEHRPHPTHWEALPLAGSQHVLDQLYPPTFRRQSSRSAQVDWRDLCVCAIVCGTLAGHRLQRWRATLLRSASFIRSGSPVHTLCTSTAWSESGPGILEAISDGVGACAAGSVYWFCGKIDSARPQRLRDRVTTS